MIRKIFITLFNVERSEFRIVFWLIFQSVFLGIFVGTYDVAAHSLFLDQFGDKAIPQAYVFSGLLGIATTFIYSQLQKYLKFSSLSLINLTYITIATGTIRVLFEVSTEEMATYMAFIFFGPLNILAILGFWGLANRIFTLRQGKRLFGIIDSGLIIGVILSMASIPILPALFGYTPDVKDLISVSSAFVLLATLIQFRILRLRNVRESNLAPIKAQKSAKKVNLIKNKYLLFMSLFVGLSMVVAFFIQFIFLAVTEKQYESSADLAMFLAQFTLAMMIVTLIVKTFVYNRLIKTYGLKVTLLILPFLLILILLGINILSYTSDVSTIESSGFMLYFILVALGRLFSNALKSGLEVPAFKLLYHSLDKEIKYDAQARIDGVVNEISAVCSGLILTGLALIFKESIFFVYVLVGILGLWIVVTFYLYKYYRDSLAHTDQLVSTKKEELGIEALIKEKKVELTPFKRHILSVINPFFIGSQEVVSDKIKNANYSYNGLSDRINSFDDIAILEALEYIEYHVKKEFTPLLLNLLKSPNDQIKFKAIQVSDKYDDPTINSILVENIKNPKFKQLLFSILSKRKSDILPMVNYHFDSSSSTYEYQKDLIDLVAQIKGKNAIEFLRKMYLRNNPRLVDLAVVRLSELGHQEVEQKETLIRLIKERLEIASWNLVVQLNLDKVEHKELYHIFDKQIAKDRVVIFNILSLIYERSMLKKAQENFELDTLEGTEMSLELMDMMLEDSIKPLVNVYFEEYSPKEKINRIADYFPIENINETNVIDMISIRDIRYLNHNIIAFAILNHFGSLSKVSLLKAHFYNPTYSIRESVQFILMNYFTEHYNELLKRMREDEKKKYYINIPQDITELVAYKFSKLIEMNSLKDLDFDHFGELSSHVNNRFVDHIEVYFDFENDLVINANKASQEVQESSLSLDRKNLFELAGDQQFLRFILQSESLA
ncbi:MAG: Npt1/Npt2 family nucleotide transporter [Crocinitomicaceae bacterium]